MMPGIEFNIMKMRIAILLILIFPFCVSAQSSKQMLPMWWENVASAGQTTAAWTNIPNLVSHWLMNDNLPTSTVVDNKGNYVGTAQRNTSIIHTNSGNPPNLNGALYFNGTSDYVVMSGSTGFNLTNVTVAGWINKPTTEYHWNLCCKNYDGIVPFLMGGLSVEGDGFHFYSSGSWKNCAYTLGRLPANQWLHLVGTYDGVNMILYVNGTQNNKVAAEGPLPTNTQPVYIGDAFWASYMNSGMIDDVRIYSRAITSNEVVRLYNNGNGTELE